MSATLANAQNCKPADVPLHCEEGAAGTGMYCAFPDGSGVRQVGIFESCAFDQCSRYCVIYTGRAKVDEANASLTHDNASTSPCFYQEGRKFCEVHDPIVPGYPPGVENHIVHTAPYEQLDDYERGYVDGMESNRDSTRAPAPLVTTSCEEDSL
jgi:hypothetical protein